MSSLPAPLLQTYTLAVETGAMQKNNAQKTVIERMANLQEQLEQRHQQGWFKKLFHKAPAIQSLYIYGEVGRGKTMLMDLFFNSLSTSRKKRIHFHDFMQEVHQRRQVLKSADVLIAVAKDMAIQAEVLCLDELQVTDIADAMILGRLLEALLGQGTVIVTTSNLKPDGLYRDGLNRDLFLPAIAMLERRFDLVSLSGTTDYRLGRVRAEETFLTPLGPETDAHLQDIWRRLTGTEKGHPAELHVLGRTLLVPQAAHGCARFSFAELCGSAKGAADYLALARNYETVFLEHVPALDPDKRNEAKRLVLLVDTFYDNFIRLVISSAKPADDIYPQGDHRFEFGRTVSRLQEMQSASWWQPHPTR